MCGRARALLILFALCSQVPHGLPRGCGRSVGPGRVSKNPTASWGTGQLSKWREEWKQQQWGGFSKSAWGLGEEGAGTGAGGGNKAGKDPVEALSACPLDGCAAAVPLDQGVAARRAVFLNEEGDVSPLISVAG